MSGERDPKTCKAHIKNLRRVSKELDCNVLPYGLPNWVASTTNLGSAVTLTCCPWLITGSLEKSLPPQHLRHVNKRWVKDSRTYL